MASYLTTQKAFRTLLNSARTNNIAHSYIFEGLKGVGKFTAAKIFANAIHCSSEGKPCGECPDCKKHAANTHSDLIIIGESGQIKVDDIRSMNEELYIKPALSQKKIIIVKDAIKSHYNEEGVLILSLFDFLLEENSLEN